MVQRANIANILKKQRAGKVLTTREEKILREALDKKRQPANAEDDGSAHEDEDRVWLTPAEFERWLPSQGVKLAHANLYKTYLSNAASNPIKRSTDGKRLHKWKGLELIRIVQGRDAIDPDTFLRRRQEASTRVIEAKAAAAEMEAAAQAGRLLDADLVKQTWTAAAEGLKNELRALVHAMPDDVRPTLETAVRQMLHNFAVSYGAPPMTTTAAPASFQALEKP